MRFLAQKYPLSSGLVPKKYLVDRTGTAKLLLGQRSPLASRPQYENDACKYLAWLHRFATSAGTPEIFSAF